MFQGVNKAVEKVRNHKPHFLIVKCYRWLEHVGVGYDWNLGYRDKKELNHWQQFDIETNPDLWEISLEEVKEINIKVKQKVEQIFRDSHNKKDADEDSLLKHVY